MTVSIEDLQEQLKKHIVAHEQLNRQIVEIAGAIKVIQKLITKGEANKAEADKQQGDSQDGGVNNEQTE